MQEQCIFELKDVTKIFSSEDMHTYALQNINLTIKNSDFLSITGPSGCGKSTLLSILGLLDTPSKGQYFINGKDVLTLTQDDKAEIRNRTIGFVFQSFNLINDLTVFENVALPFTYHSPKVPLVEIKARVDECLEMVDMSHRAKHTPNKLSGGQQQRVSIARALACRPGLLLVDEATGNLDAANGDAIMDMLLKLNKEGVTICMVTHDLRYAGMAKTKVQLTDGLIK